MSPLVSLDRSARKLLRKAEHPRWLAPMQASKGSVAKGQWIYEPEFGERIIVNKRGDAVFLLTAENADVSDVHREIVKWFAGQEGNFLVEGELCDDVFYVSDALYVNGYDLRGLSLLHRKALLHNLLRFDDAVRFKPYFHNRKECESRWEYPIVAKEARSTYTGKKSRFWRMLRGRR